MGSVGSSATLPKPQISTLRKLSGRDWGPRSAGDATRVRSFAVTSLNAFAGGAEAGEPPNHGPNSIKAAMISNPAANTQNLDLGTKCPSLSFRIDAFADWNAAAAPSIRSIAAQGARLHGRMSP